MSPLNPIEHEMIKSIMQGALKDSFKIEVLKGRDTSIYKEPVDIEPYFYPYEQKSFLRPDNVVPVQQTVNKLSSIQRRAFLQLWFSPKDENTWQNFEILLKEISIIRSPIEFLLLGNCKRIVIQLSSEQVYIEVIKNALKSHFQNIQITTDTEHSFSYFFEKCKISPEELYDIRDFYPGSYYWETMDGVSDNTNSPLLPIFYSLSQIKNDEFGFYQVVFKRISDQWRDNISNLILAQAESTSHAEIYQNQHLSNLDHKEAKNKINAHSFFATSLRIGLFSKNNHGKEVLDSLNLSIGKIRYGKKELKFLSKTDYESVLTKEQIENMIFSGLVYRPGMILTTSELNILCHISTDIIARKDIPLDHAVSFPITELYKKDGVLLGYTEYEGKKINIHQPEFIRNSHTSILGKISMGKSQLQATMILDDIKQGKGLAYIDPHSDTVQQILPQIPKERVNDVIYFNPCDDQVFQYNPLNLNVGEDINLRTEQMIDSLRDFYTSREWSYIIEGILYSLFYTLFSGKNLSLSDSRILLSKSYEGEMLRKSILPAIDNEEVQMFWTEEFENIPKSNIERAYGKIRRFLQPKKISRIFSQKKNALNFTEIMNEKKIFLADINSGNLGADASNILGSTLISQFYYTGMQRLSDAPEKRVPFTLYVDELSNFKVKSIELALLHLRKCKVNLVLAFQQYEGLNESVQLALGNCGTMIVFSQDWTNAHNTFKKFLGAVDVNEFMDKGVGQAYLKIGGSNIVSLNTFGPQKVNGEGYLSEIIKNNSKYYAQPEAGENFNYKNQSDNSYPDGEELFDEI